MGVADVGIDVKIVDVKTAGERVVDVGVVGV